MDQNEKNRLADHLRKIIISEVNNVLNKESPMARQQGLAVEAVTKVPKPRTQLKIQAKPTDSSLGQTIAQFPQPQSTRNQPSQPQLIGKLIGTAVPAELFLLLETPLPWNKPALLSEGVPEVVRQALKPHLGRYPGLRVHLIANEATAVSSARRLLMFKRQTDSPQGYAYQEIQTPSPEQMAAAIADQLTPKSNHSNSTPFSQLAAPSSPRHLLICTHGSHNECCGVQGYPLYQEAIALTNALNLHETQIWQVSHIGGHRYAPTLIDLPQGRYYGELNSETLKLLLQQQGNLEQLMQCYRGWSLLPKHLQHQEKFKFIEAGWSWLEQGSWQQLSSHSHE